MTDVVEDVDLEAFVEAAERPHIACCLADVFLCGAAYHPELHATEDDEEEDCCQRCIEVMYEMMCPPGRPATHYHCGLDRLRFCPGG